MVQFFDSRWKSYKKRTKCVISQKLKRYLGVSGEAQGSVLVCYAYEVYNEQVGANVAFHDQWHRKRMHSKKWTASEAEGGVRIVETFVASPEVGKLGPSQVLEEEKKASLRGCPCLARCVLDDMLRANMRRFG